MTHAFISYSWDSEEHKAWVRELAEQISGGGINTTLDQWSTAPGDSLTRFMEEAIRDNPCVIIVCTPRYKLRSDRREGPVGYEGDIMTGEVLVGKSRRKFIPVLRAAEWQDAAPSWLLACYYVDLRGEHWRNRLPLLLDTLHHRLPTPPPVRAQGFVHLSDGDVLDNVSGLVWTYCRDADLIPLEEVAPLLLRKCQATGHQWRLPSDQEVANVKSAEEYFPRPPIMVTVKCSHPLFGTFEKGPWTPKIRSNAKSAGARGGGVFHATHLDQRTVEALALGRQFPIRFVRESNEEDRLSIVNAP